MVRSMTGYGKGSARYGAGVITVEVKTVNHKFLDLALKIPEAFSPFEDKIKEVAQRSLARGKVSLAFTYDGALPREHKTWVDLALAKSYHAQLVKVKHGLGIPGEITLKDIVDLPGVVTNTVSEKSFARLWPHIKEALDEAVVHLIGQRRREGRAIEKDLKKRAGTIARLLAVVKSRAHLTIEEYRKKFGEKIRDLARGRQIDVGRLEVEVAIYAKNSDISEEISRISSHLANFRATIEGGGDVGKKLDFIAQELHREINTIGSKANDIRISRSVIDVKSEVEKIREQVKNLE